MVNLTATPKPWDHIWSFLPEILIFAFCAVMLLGGLIVREDRNKARLVWRTQWLIVGAGVFLFIQLFFPEARLVHQASLYTKDTLGLFIGLLVIIFIWPWLACSPKKLERSGITQMEYYVLLGLSLLGVFVMLSASHLLTLYLGAELQVLPLYALIAMRRTFSKAIEAGLKYFILGALASGLMVFGMAFIYGATGHLDYHLIHHMYAEPLSGIFTVGMIMILAGLCFKVAAAPFHMWAPDVYAGCTNGQTSVLAIVAKMAGIVVLIRLLYLPLQNLTEIWQNFLVYVVITSLFVGALGALWQTKIRRLIAYSGISHMGFMLMAFLSGVHDVSALLTYVVAYFLTLFLFFGCLKSLFQDGEELTLLVHLKGLARTHPLCACLLAVSIFSMMGIPPLAGFWGKFSVLLVVVESQYYLVAFLGVISTVISAFYYLKIVKYMYFDTSEAVVVVKDRLWPYVLVMLSVILFGWWQSFLETPFYQITSQLLVGK